jgi:serine/threonine protein kinase
MPPKFTLPQALLDDADQIRRVVEEETRIDHGESQPFECLSPDSVDQVATVESKDHASQVREVSIALVREFLAAHRRELRSSMDTFEAAVPREPRGLNKRSAIARLVKLDTIPGSNGEITEALPITQSAARFDELESPPTISILERLVSAVLARGLAPVGVPVSSNQQRRVRSNNNNNNNQDDEQQYYDEENNGMQEFDDLLAHANRNPSLNFGFGIDGQSVDINGFSVGQTCALSGGGQFSVFSLSDLDREDAVVIGQGAGGRVLRMRHRDTDDYYAVKEIVVGSAQTVNEVKKEISVLWGTSRNHDDLPSPFLITCHGIFYEQGMLYIVMDLMACSLKDALEAHGPFAEIYLRAMFYQVLHGLHYLHHTKKQLHRDIKPHNILISDMGSVKISDFGIASERVNTLHHNARHTFCGTLSYMSPGRAEGLPYSFEADIWGVGMSLYQLAIGELPEGSRSVFAIAEFRQNPPRLPSDNEERFSKDFQDFVALCLQPDHSSPGSKQITVKDLLHHSWMRGMTLERSQRSSADVARHIVAMMQHERDHHHHHQRGNNNNNNNNNNNSTNPHGRHYGEFGPNGTDPMENSTTSSVDALAALDDVIAETNI